MQAIVTKFHGPGNVRGSRVSARADAGSITVGWNHSKNVGDNHAAAALALLQKLGWDGRWIGGGLPGSGFAFVCDPLQYRAERSVTV
jgi:hypothetical protein